MYLWDFFFVPTFIIYFWDIMLISVSSHDALYTSHSIVSLLLILYFIFVPVCQSLCFSALTFLRVLISLFGIIFISISHPKIFSRLARLSKHTIFSIYIISFPITISSHSKQLTKNSSAIFATLNLIVQQLLLWIVSVSISMDVYVSSLNLSFLLQFFFNSSALLCHNIFV